MSHECCCIQRENYLDGPAVHCYPTSVSRLAAAARDDVFELKYAIIFVCFNQLVHIFPICLPFFNVCKRRILSLYFFSDVR